MLINEIFTSIDGEAKRAGELATFIRTVGCNLRCSYCDSKYTWGTESTNKNMSVEEIIEECDRFGVPNITFTGGEPLLQKDADELILNLGLHGYDVGIETDGAVDFTSRIWFASKDYSLDNIWVCVDYKCPSSGMNDKMLPLDKFAQLRSRDVLKFVVGSQEDLNKALEVMDYLRAHNCDCYFYLSPVFGQIQPVEIVEFMQLHKLTYKTRFQVQLHKIVWDPDKRGV